MKSNLIQFRMHSDEFNELKNKLNEEGYLNVSDYVRTSLLGNLAEIKELIKEIHELSKDM